MKKSRYFLFVVLLTVISLQIKAQESILNEVDYTLLDTLIAKAKQNYPRVKILAHQTDIAKTNVGKANASWLDAVNFNYIYGNNSLFNIGNPNGVVNGYQAGLNINLGLILQKPLNVKSSKSELKIAQLEQSEYDLFIVSEVKKRYFTYLQYLAALKIQSKSAEDATASLNDIKYRYEKGEVIFNEYNEALIAQSNIMKTKIETETGFFIAKAALEEIVGQPLEQISVNGRK